MISAEMTEAGETLPDRVGPGTQIRGGLLEMAGQRVVLGGQQLVEIIGQGVAVWESVQSRKSKKCQGEESTFLFVVVLVIVIEADLLIIVGTPRFGQRPDVVRLGCSISA